MNPSVHNIRFRSTNFEFEVLGGFKLQLQVPGLQHMVPLDWKVLEHPGSTGTADGTQLKCSSQTSDKYLLEIVELISAQPLRLCSAQSPKPLAVLSDCRGPIPDTAAVVLGVHSVTVHHDETIPLDSYRSTYLAERAESGLPTGVVRIGRVGNGFWRARKELLLLICCRGGGFKLVPRTIKG